MSNYFSFQQLLIDNSASNIDYKYEEVFPISELADMVYCYWNLSSPKNGKTLTGTITPDPCINIFFDTNNVNNVYILGPTNKPFKFEFPYSSPIFGIRLLPGRFSMLSSVPVNSILNKLLPFDEHFYDKYKLPEIDPDKLDIDTLQNYAKQQILNVKQYSMSKASRLDVFDSLEYIYESKGSICISDLAKFNDCSIRTLSRKYDAMIGINPKLLCRIVRFQYTLLNYTTNPNTNLSELALVNGYYDQSHFTKDFKEFIGLPPSILIFN